jgi:hypothetical protein
LVRRRRLAELAGQQVRGHGEKPTNAETVSVESITIDDVLARLSPLDYLHLDVQGEELKVLAHAPGLLSERVLHCQIVNIGTHAAEIEAGLRDLFRAQGWQSVYDFAMNSKRLVKSGDRTELGEFGDGVQVWKKPRFG